MSVEVRPLLPGDDVEHSGEVVRRAYRALPDYPHDRAYATTIGAVADRAVCDTVVVATLDGRVVGCLTYVGPDSEHYEFDDPEASSFRYFGVDPRAQGAGVGAAMVDWCVERARSEGRRRLRIHTLESMPAAMRLYQRKGFVRDPARDEDWGGVRGIAFVHDL